MLAFSPGQAPLQLAERGLALSFKPGSAAQTSDPVSDYSGGIASVRVRSCASVYQSTHAPM